MSISNDPRSTSFAWPVRVYYEDTDAGGVVYHARYLAFCERARTEWLRALGHEQDELRERRGLLFAVRRIALDYRAPARFNDCLTVVSRLMRVGGASLDFAQQVLRDADHSCCCEAQVKVACIHVAGMRAARLPDDLLSEFALLVSGAAEPLS